jgi:hypothetical protein
MLPGFNAHRRLIGCEGEVGRRGSRAPGAAPPPCRWPQWQDSLHRKLPADLFHRVKWHCQRLGACPAAHPPRPQHLRPWHHPKQAIQLRTKDRRSGTGPPGNHRLYQARWTSLDARAGADVMEPNSCMTPPQCDDRTHDSSGDATALTDGRPLGKFSTDPIANGGGLLSGHHPPAGRIVIGRACLYRSQVRRASIRSLRL